MYAGVGEPPLCMSCSALFAIKRAIENFRAEIKTDTVFILGIVVFEMWSYMYVYTLLLQMVQLLLKKHN